MARRPPRSTLTHTRSPYWPLFLSDLGTTSRAVVDRPRRPRSDDPVFAPPPAFTDLPVLEDKRLDLEAIYFIDWATALHRLALDGVGFSGGRAIDEVQNARLGPLLTEHTGRAASGEGVCLNV